MLNPQHPWVTSNGRKRHVTIPNTPAPSPSAPLAFPLPCPATSSITDTRTLSPYRLSSPISFSPLSPALGGPGGSISHLTSVGRSWLPRFWGDQMAVSWVHPLEVAHLEPHTSVVWKPRHRASPSRLPLLKWAQTIWAPLLSPLPKGRAQPHGGLWVWGSGIVHPASWQILSVRALSYTLRSCTGSDEHCGHVCFHPGVTQGPGKHSGLKQ